MTGNKVNGAEIDARNHISREKEKIMRKKEILNGIFVYPADWIEVTVNEPEESSYVGHVETKNGKKLNVPHFFFCSKTDPYSIPEDIEEMIMKQCCDRSDAFAEAYEERVFPDYDKEKGRFTNTAECRHGYTPMIFKVAREDEIPNHPFNAKIITFNNKKGDIYE